MKYTIKIECEIKDEKIHAQISFTGNPLVKDVLNTFQSQQSLTQKMLVRKLIRMGNDINSDDFFKNGNKLSVSDLIDKPDDLIGEIDEQHENKV